MKKFFLFAAVAGMLASCSSESLTGSDPNIEPTQEERVPIKLGVTSPSVRATTRGTGTVGGVGTSDPNNVWAGQKIRAFMFKKGEAALTLATETDNSTILYKNELLITPGVAANKTPDGASSTDIGEAMLSDGAIKYYPPKGNFDFFGYHGDDATGALNETLPTLWTVPFTINGSQDLMSTKAVLTDAQATAMGQSTDYYSAKAARKDVQPVLSFNHLLSRLSFVIVPGNDNAGGWIADQAATYYSTLEEYNAAIDPDITQVQFDALTQEEKIKDPAVAAHQDATKAVYVKSIEVESKTTGKMAVAWTGDDPEMITWDEATQGDPKWLQLKERPTYYLTDDKTFTISDALYDLLPVTAAYYVNNTDATIRISETAYAALDAGEQANYTEYTGDYYLKLDDPSDRISAMEYAGLDDDVKATYRKGYYKSNFTAVGADVANNNLTNLTPTYPKMTHAYDAANKEETSVGEALIVAPKKAEAYKMKVTVVQKVPTNWNTIDNPSTYVDKEMTYDLDIDAPGNDPDTEENEGEFEANTSYKVILTVYGFERIQVTTKITPWQTGAAINVGQD